MQNRKQPKPYTFGGLSATQILDLMEALSRYMTDYEHTVWELFSWEESQRIANWSEVDSKQMDLLALFVANYLVNISLKQTIGGCEWTIK